MDKIRVGFRAVGKVDRLHKDKIEEQMRDLFVEIMLNYVDTYFYLREYANFDSFARRVLLQRSQIIKKAKRKKVIKVLACEDEILLCDIEDGLDDVIRSNKNYDDWLLENCDLIVGDDSQEFYKSDFLKKAEKSGKKIYSIKCN